MTLKPKWTKSTLANNLKYMREERAISQKNLAKSAGVSYRLVQEIESGSANPTMGTLHNLAVAFKVTVKDLLSLSRVRLLEGDNNFLERYADAFKSEELGIGIRTLNGICVWGNRSVEKIHGALPLAKGPFNLLETYSEEAKGLLQNQMAAEKKGFCHPYTIAHYNPKDDEHIFLRCYPTLIMPNSGNVPMYTSVYITNIEEDGALNYYMYCNLLLGVVYEIL